MFGIGPMELVLILVVALLVFGPKRLPELARTLGRGMGEFRRASADLRQSLALDDLQKDLREGLSGENSIHRPAQAGDSLPDPKKSEDAADASVESDDSETPETSGTPETPETSRTSEGQSGEEEATAQLPHPGELPLDNDYEHNEVAAESESADPAAERAPEPAREEPKPTKSPEPSQPPEPTMGDSGLGNIPVSRPAVGARKSDPERG